MVAILAVLAALVGGSVRSTPRPVDIARRVGVLIEQAGRDAVRHGTVAPALAASEGSKRRTRVRAEAGPVFILEVLENSGTWSEVASYQVPGSIIADGFANAVGTYSALSSSLSTDWTDFGISCFPSGSCTGATLFFSATRGSRNAREGRISVLPLGGATYIRSTWE